MIIVVASAHDPRARDLVAYWGSQCATLLAAEDLSRSGWVLEVPKRAGGRCVAGRQIWPDKAITGVLTLRPRIFAEELAHVAAADRGYVAAEMTAVLRTWLAMLRCPVINPPSNASLAGPNWRAPRWRDTAADLGLPLADQGSEGGDVIVVGGQCFGTSDPQRARGAAALACAAGTALMGCRFTLDGRFISATPWPALDWPGVRDRLRELLAG